MAVGEPPEGPFLDDLPLEAHSTAHDHWDRFVKLAEKLSDDLPFLPPCSPVLVWGDWGAGKTSFIRRVEAILRARSADGQDTPVWFNAWQYEQGGLLVPALYQAIVDAAPVRKGLDARKLKKVGEAVVRKALVLSAGGLIGQVVAGLFGKGFDLEKVVTEAGKGASEALQGGLGDPGKALWNEMDAFVAMAWPGQGPVVLIDDLDRCSPTSAVTLIEQIRHLVARGSESLPGQQGAASRKLRFVLAADRDVVGRAVAQKYKGLDGFDANRYLEKVFPLAVRVPSLDQTSVPRLIGHLLEDLKRRNAGEKALARTQVTEAFRRVFKNDRFANPRLIKRTMNRFVAFLRFGGHIDLDRPDRDEAELLIDWLAATDRWPDLRRVVHFDESYWNAMGKALAENLPHMPGPDAERLRQAAGLVAWLQETKVLPGGQVGDRFRELLAMERRLAGVGL